MSDFHGMYRVHPNRGRLRERKSALKPSPSSEILAPSSLLASPLVFSYPISDGYRRTYDRILLPSPFPRQDGRQPQPSGRLSGVAPHSAEVQLTAGWWQEYPCHPPGPAWLTRDFLQN